jgi:chromosome segregation ATPase
MPPMSEQPLTRAILTSVLADFHRKVIAPDFKRVFERLDRMDARFDDIDTHFDDVYRRFERLETEYQALKAGLGRVEARLDHLEAQVHELRTRLGHVEERLEELIALEERYPLRTEVQDLKARVELLHEDVRRLEQRLKG